ncbi:T9SS type A sorting domain-containing protein, partial [Cryomorpha ignava]
NYSPAAAMTDRGMYNDAMTLLDSMQLSYKLSTEQSDEMNELKTLYGFIKSVSDDGRSIDNLNSAEISDLQNIAEDATAGRAAIKAQNALCFHYNICYDTNGIPKSNTAPRKPKATYDELIAGLNTSSAFPNPADPYITISFNFLQAQEESALIVYDNLGRQLLSRQLGKVYEGQELIDTRKLPNGIYFFQLLQNGKKVSEGKFITSH